MKSWVGSTIIFVLSLLQISVVDHIKVFNTKPDLILIGVIIAALFCKRKWALILGLCAGAFKDIVASQAPGINAVFCFVWSLAVIQARRRFSLDFNGARVLLVGVIFFLQSLLTRIVFLYLGTPVSPGIFLRTALLGSVYTALVSLGVFKILRIK
jgi:rod shape-determining protein MreD